MPPYPRTTRLAAVAALALTAACSSATTPVRDALKIVAPDRPFSLAVGQSAELDEAASGAPLRITFVGVTNDSRCAEDVQCVWEGDARVALRLQSAAAEADTAAHTSGRFTPDPELAGFRVSVEGLAPNTRTDRPIAASQYVATLRVTRR
jgi:hypothetical protein